MAANRAAGTNLNAYYELGVDGTVRPQGSGFVVQSVEPGGPLTSATNTETGRVRSLRPGDTILSINSRQILNAGAWLGALDALAATNGEANLLVVDGRTAARETVKVNARRYQSNTGSRPAVGPSGNNGTSSNQSRPLFDLGIRGNLRREGGFLIRNLVPNGPATRVTNANTGEVGSLKTGDIVLSINSRQIAELGSYRAALNALSATDGQATLVVLDPQTGGQSSWRTNAISTQPAIQNGNGQPPQTTTGGEAATGRIHILVCGAPDPNISDSVNSTVNDLSTIIRQQIDSNLIATEKYIRNEECSRDGIIAELDQLVVEGEDAILFYYIGHGAFSENGTGGHFFDFEGYDLMRREVSTRLKEKRARLIVLISESCNQVSVPKLPEPQMDAFQRSDSRSMDVKPVYPKTLEKLLMNYRGMVNVNSASRGQLGWGTQDGGFFSTALMDKMQIGWFSPYGGEPPMPEWPSIISSAGDRANEKFQSLKQEQLEKLSAFSPLSQSQTSLKQQLEAQIEMTPAIMRMTVR